MPYLPSNIHEYCPSRKYTPAQFEFSSDQISNIKKSEYLTPRLSWLMDHITGDIVKQSLPLIGKATDYAWMEIKIDAIGAEIIGYAMRSKTTPDSAIKDPFSFRFEERFKTKFENILKEALSSTPAIESDVYNLKMNTSDTCLTSHKLVELASLPSLTG